MGGAFDGISFAAASAEAASIIGSDLWSGLITAAIGLMLAFLGTYLLLKVIGFRQS